MRKFARYAIISLLGIVLAFDAAKLAYAINTILTESTTWCASVSAPSPGDPVRASSLTGGIRTALQCLTDRTHSLMKGTVTVKGLQADGTGGAASVEAAGEILASADVTSATAAGVNNATGNAYVVPQGLSWNSVTTGGGGANPPAGTGLTNTLTASLAPKAWGRYTTDGTGGAPGTGGNLTQLDGANSIATLKAGEKLVEVDFGANMNSTGYAIIANCVAIQAGPIRTAFGTAVVPANDGTYPPTAAKFYIVATSASGTLQPVDPHQAALDCSYIVMGKQTN